MLSPSPKQKRVERLEEVPKVLNQGMNFHMDFTSALSGHRQESTPMATEENLMHAQDTYPNEDDEVLNAEQPHDIDDE
jgi:hypothetical protein